MTQKFLVTPVLLYHDLNTMSSVKWKKKDNKSKR